MTYYNNDGNKFKIYFAWVDKSMNEYHSWEEAKRENHGKPIYLTAMLYSRLTCGTEPIMSIRFDKKPRSTKKIKQFMTETFSYYSKYVTISFAGYKK